MERFPIKSNVKLIALSKMLLQEERNSLKAKLWNEWVGEMERFHLEIELDDDDARRVQAVLMANDMTIKQFADYAIVKVAEAHVGDDLLTD